MDASIPRLIHERTRIKIICVPTTQPSALHPRPHSSPRYNLGAFCGILVSIEDILEVYDRIIKLKQEVLRKSSELVDINNELTRRIHIFASNVKSCLQK